MRREESQMPHGAEIITESMEFTLLSGHIDPARLHQNFRSLAMRDSMNMLKMFILDME